MLTGLIMEKQVCVLLLCLLSITEGIPVSSPQSPTSYSLLVPVRVLGSNGPQMVLVPVTEWGTQRNQNPTAQSERTLTLAEPEQHHVQGQNWLENPNVNSPFLQLRIAAPNTPVPENPPLPYQEQVLPPVWNNIPGVNGQMFVPVWAPPAGGAADGQRQSNSASSEEGDAQVIYIFPLSAEIPNMGMMEGGQGANTNANLRPNPDPNPGHLQQNPTPSPGPTPSPVPSPALPAGVHENPDPLRRAPPSVGAGQRTEDVTTSCSHKGGAANADANTLSL